MTKTTHDALLHISEPEKYKFLGMVEVFKGDCGSDECWNWGGPKAKNGYGGVQIGGRPQTAHRVSLYISTGMLPKWNSYPEGICATHKCSNRLCVNPSHLEWATNHKNHTEDKRRDEVHPTGEFHHWGVYTDEAVYKAKTLLKTTTMTNTEIAKATDLTPSTVSGVKNGRIRGRETDWKPIDRPAGYVCQVKKLTKEDVERIKTLLKTTTETDQSIAEEFGLAKSTVRRIRIGKLHKSNEDEEPIHRPDGARKEPVKITDEILAKIDEALNAPKRLSQEKIAQSLGISRSVVLRRHLGMAKQNPSPE